MKKPTEILKEEHQSVLEKLAGLEGVIRHLDRKEKTSARLQELMSFFDTDFWVHFDKEEKALFPEFDNFMPRGAGPLAVMMDEHEVLRETNEIMQSAVTRYLDHGDDTEARKTMTESGMHFIEFLRGHIFKEDSILFRMAEMHLGERQNEKVVKLIAEIEKAAQTRSGGR